MKKAANEQPAAPPDAEHRLLRELKHDINNQLSNILLALEQLRDEVPEGSEDCSFYFESIVTSASKISSLMESAVQKDRES